MTGRERVCYCGHDGTVHEYDGGVCLAGACFCSFYRPQPTAQGVRAPGGGTSLPQQAQNEGTP